MISEDVQFNRKADEVQSHNESTIMQRIRAIKMQFTSIKSNADFKNKATKSEPVSIIYYQKAWPGRIRSAADDCAQPPAELRNICAETLSSNETFFI